jgi:glycosyltransferase involved in cell wall biosynthesis
MARPRVLLAYHFFHPDDVVSARLFTDLAVGLNALGWDVTALASDRAWANPETCYPPSERYAGIAIERVHRPAWGQSRPIERLGNSGWLISAWLHRMARMTPFDAVVVGSDPSFAPLLLIPLRRWWPKAATVHWCYDLYPEAIAADGTSQAIRALYPWAERLMAAAYRRCDVNVDLGPGMRRRLAKYENSAMRASVPPWALTEPAAAPRAPDPVVRQQLFGRAKLGLLYSGNLGRAHGLRQLLNLARACRTRSGSDIAFCFSCRGHRLDELRAALVPEDSNVRIAPFCAEDQLAAQLEAAELHLLSLQPAWSGLVVPSKFFGSLAVGRPVVYVGPDDSDIAQWVSDLDVGYVVPQGRLHETVDALHALAASPDALQVMQRRAKRVYDEHFCKEVGLAAWNRLLSQRVGRAGPAAGVH